MKKCVLIVLSSILMVSGCNQNKLHDGIIVINDEDAIEVMFEDVANDINVVPIVSDEPIDECIKYLVSGNEMLMLGMDSKTIYYFVDNELKGKLCAYGQGPNEYYAIKTFTYSPDEHIIYIVDSYTNKILSYIAPEMKFHGKTDNSNTIQYIAEHDSNSFITLMNSADNDSCFLQIIDKKDAKCKRVLMNAPFYTVGDADNTMSGYSKHHHSLALSAYINKIGTITDDGFQCSLQFNYGDKNIPEDVMDFQIGDVRGFPRLIEFANTPEAELCLSGDMFPKVSKGTVSFWYQKAMGSIHELSYYRNSNGNIVHYKGFHIPGINRNVSPFCNTEDGYVMVFQGTSDMIRDYNTNPSDLALKIFDVMDHQIENNPVLLFFNIK